MRLPFQLGRASAAAKVPLESVERLLNAYLENTPEGKEPTPIYGTPGLLAWSAGLDGETRGGLEMAGVAYFVAGEHLYSIDANGTETNHGDIPGTDMVAMAGDGTNVVTVAGGRIYVFDQTSLQLVTDPDAPLASSVAWVDGYFVFGEVNTDTFFICALGDPTDYDALDFAAAEWQPDVLVTPFAHRRTLYMFGAKTLEAQQNVGGADFPFARYEDVFIQVGLVGRDAVTGSNDALFWMANDLTVRRLDGLTATVISTPAMGKLIRSWSDASLTVASSHVWEDHLFITFRNPDGCIEYDQATDRWHERGSHDSDTWRCRHLVECYGKVLAGSATEGKIYQMDAETYDEDGDILPFEIITPWAYARGLRLCITELIMMVQVAVGSLTLDPQITCERTHDGETWSTRISRHLGKIGERSKRVTFGPQGQSVQAAFRLRITDPVKRAVLAAYAEVDVES